MNLIHEPTHTPVHPPIGWGVSTNHKSSELNYLKNSPIRGWGDLSKMSKIELSQLGQDLFDFSDLT